MLINVTISTSYVNSYIDLVVDELDARATRGKVQTKGVWENLENIRSRRSTDYKLTVIVEAY
jgi:hypothetical protein